MTFVTFIYAKCRDSSFTMVYCGQRATTMAGLILQLVTAILVHHATVYISPVGSSSVKDGRCPTGFANFGDSLTDTANALDAFPFFADPENRPYGETFFGAPAKRFSNGRLVPDFFSLAFKFPLLDGYFATTSFNYKHGINFAVAGAAASLVPTEVPFSLSFQVAQFIRFQNSANATKKEKACLNFALDLPEPVDYSKWLYTLELGGNDILSPLTTGIPVAEINSTIIPAAVNNISRAIQILYSKSARNFLVFNIPPQGCSTIALTLFAGLGPLDSLGCVDFLNGLNRYFNNLLLSALQNLRATLPGASIAYFDYYAVNIEIFTNPQLHGFNPSLTTTACCGAPGVGTLNYNPKITCGRPGSNVCSNPLDHINWDGIHFTENFYRIVSWFALSGQYTDHGINYTSICNPDFRNFGNNATYRSVYGRKCSNEFQ